MDIKLKKYPLFSNGTEFMEWQSRNCEKCVKAVFYDEKKDRWPKYLCTVQKHIEEAAVTDGCGNKRDYEATHSYDCPYKQTERKPRKVKKDKRQLELWTSNNMTEEQKSLVSGYISRSISDFARKCGVMCDDVISVIREMYCKNNNNSL